MMDTTIMITPNDHWLHAMDIDTHLHPQTSQRGPYFRDKVCQSLSKEKTLLRLHLKRLYIPKI